MKKKEKLNREIYNKKIYQFIFNIPQILITQEHKLMSTNMLSCSDNNTYPCFWFLLRFVESFIVTWASPRHRKVMPYAFR